jgi:hypothetical protein
MTMCNYCGSTTGDGRFDWLGRYECNRCRRTRAAAVEAGRLVSVATEVAERAAMWGLSPACDCKHASECDGGDDCQRAPFAADPA